MSDYQNELITAERAANEASQIIRKFQDDRDFFIDFKGKNDLVTEADLKSQEKILGILKNEFPEDHILAEESAAEMQMPHGRLWLVDPIDGTTNFAHGFPVYCVSIALWKDGVPKMGVVLEVNSGECFTARAGEGAFLNDQPIKVSGLNNSKNGLFGTGFPYNDMRLIDDYLNYFRMLMNDTQGVRRAGAAAYDLCLVASGRLDGFYEYSLHPWDVGAAALIVQEAGGSVSDWKGGNDWLFGERIIAGNADMHAFLLESIGKHFTDAEITK